MVTYSVVHSYDDGVLFGNKEEKAIDVHNLKKNLQRITASERATPLEIPFIEHFCNDKIIETENRLVVAGIRREREGKLV